MCLSSDQNLLKFCAQSHLHFSGEILFVSRFVKEKKVSSQKPALIEYHLKSHIKYKVSNKAQEWDLSTFLKKNLIRKWMNYIKTPVVCSVILLLGINCQRSLPHTHQFMKDITGYPVFKAWGMESLSCSLNVLHNVLPT